MIHAQQKIDSAKPAAFHSKRVDEKSRIAELWQYRNLLYFLCLRDLKVRYKQTFLGVIWAIVQPLASTVVFTVLFGKIAKLPSDGVPYPLFSLAALIPWTYFSGSVSRCSQSVVNNGHLISKVYFPRIIIPISSVLPGALDFCLSLVFLLGVMFYFGYTPPVNALLMPAYFFWASALSLSVGLWLGAIHVRFRDVGHALPLIVQLWMYATPVIFPTSFIPQSYRWLMSLNPVAGIVEGFRGCLFGLEVSPHLIAIGLIQTVILLITGAWFFQRRSSTFADIV